MSTAPNHSRAELPNGLRLLAVALPHVHRVVLDAHLHVGPRYEQRERCGISHFLEHMLYRGTARHPSAHAQALAFEALGGTLVAATYVDHGSMTIGVPPRSWDNTLALFAELFQAPIFDGIEIEKGIVREEILEGMDDDGTAIDADNLIREAVFPGHGLGFPITGTLSELAAFDRPGLSAHHQRHYVGSGTVLAVAGPIDPERVLLQLTQRFGDLPRGDIAVAAAAPGRARSGFSFVRHSSSQTALRVAFRAPAQRDRLEPATDMLLRLIDDGMSTRLYHRVCDLRGLCYDVSAGYEAYADAGLFELCAETAHERAPAVLDELLGMISELREHGPEDGELDKARTRAAWQLEEVVDSPGELAELYAFGELMGGARTPAERHAELLAVTPELVREAAERVFRPDNLHVVAVGLASKKLKADLAKRIARFD